MATETIQTDDSFEGKSSTFPAARVTGIRSSFNVAEVQIDGIPYHAVITFQFALPLAEQTSLN